jgi:hypothetical protein
MKSPSLPIAVVCACLGCKTGEPAQAKAEVGREASPDKLAATVAGVDQALHETWAKENIVPAPKVDDARFIRRVYLDVIGTVPSPEAVRVFLGDSSPDKRPKLVDTLLRDPRYSEHWARYWEATLLGRKFREQIVDREAFRDFLRSRFDANAGWNTVAFELIDANGQNSHGNLTPEMAMPETAEPGAMAGSMATSAMMTTPDGNGGPVVPNDDRVNGAVNWYLRFDRNPADEAGTVSRVFLGVQVQCAQCHDHPTEKWTQQDFRRLAACFTRTRVEPIDKGKVMGKRRVLIEDLNHPIKQGIKQNPDLRDYIFARPTALDGTDLSTAAYPRQALASWITDKRNPWFAKASVNRLWGHFLGRGFVDPVDDFRDSNPPVLPQVLNALADDFVASGYDLRHEIRLITATDAYQRDSTPIGGTANGDRLWARYHLKPLGPEEMLNALIEATHLQPIIEEAAGDDLERLRQRLEQQFVFLFDVDEESEQMEFEGTIPQALFLLNGQMLNAGASGVPGAALSEVLATDGGDDAKIEALYLRALARPPTIEEVGHWRDFVNTDRSVAHSVKQPPGVKVADKPDEKKPRKPAGPDPLARLNKRLTQPQQTPRLQAYEDMFWALLNSSEFNFNH